jgi:hypothetical protein
MSKTTGRAARGAFLALLALGPAAAGAADKTLYVKAKNTRLMQKPSATADAVSVLQPPQAVSWKGAVAGAPQWHQVAVAGKQGFVFQANLAARPPSLELVAGAGAGKVDARAFANSGAAVKAVSPGVRQAALQDREVGRAVSQLERLESLAKKVGDAEVAAHVKRAGLPQVVGAEAAR